MNIYLNGSSQQDFISDCYLFSQQQSHSQFELTEKINHFSCRCIKEQGFWGRSRFCPDLTLSAKTKIEEFWPLFKLQCGFIVSSDIVIFFSIFFQTDQVSRIKLFFTQKQKWSVLWLGIFFILECVLLCIGMALFLFPVLQFSDIFSILLYITDAFLEK